MSGTTSTPALTPERMPEKGHYANVRSRLPDSKGRCVAEHRAVAEVALGRRLPPGAQVHHVDCVRSNNDPSNLVICQDRAYHALLHRRMLARAECGDPSALRCQYCHKYDRQDDIVTSRRGERGTMSYHRDCNRARSRDHHRRHRDAHVTRMRERRMRKRGDVSEPLASRTDGGING